MSYLIGSSTQLSDSLDNLDNTDVENDDELFDIIVDDEEIKEENTEIIHENIKKYGIEYKQKQLERKRKIIIIFSILSICLIGTLSYALYSLIKIIQYGVYITK